MLYVSIQGVQSFSLRVKLTPSWGLPDCPGPLSVPWPHLPHSSFPFPFQQQAGEFIACQMLLPESLLGVGSEMSPRTHEQLTALSGDMEPRWQTSATRVALQRVVGWLHFPVQLSTSRFTEMWEVSSFCFLHCEIRHDLLTVVTSRPKPRTELNLSEVVSGIYLTVRKIISTEPLPILLHWEHFLPDIYTLSPR